MSRPNGIQSLRVEVSAGEFFDKLAILEIKAQRIRDPAKLDHVRAELAALEATRRRSVPTVPGLAPLVAELKQVNGQLWEIEDAIRQCERAQDFGPRFVELARSIYRQNDRRSALKRQINELLGSRLVEEKQYVEYG